MAVSRLPGAVFTGCESSPSGPVAVSGIASIPFSRVSNVGRSPWINACRNRSPYSLTKSPNRAKNLAPSKPAANFSTENKKGSRQRPSTQRIHPGIPFSQPLVFRQALSSPPFHHILYDDPEAGQHIGFDRSVHQRDIA